MADCLSAFVACCGILPQINDFVVTPLWNQFRYLFRYNDFIHQLSDEVGRLNEERGRLQGRIYDARRNLEVILPSVEDSIKRADAMQTKANRILDTVPQVQNSTCLSETCPNLKSRYSLGKQAKEMTEDVKQLREECGKFERVSHPAPPSGTKTIPPTTSGTLEFESRKHKEEEIMKCLRDDKILMIGICGMGGIGKTTMVDKILKRASEGEEKLFDESVRVIVGGQDQKVDLLKIQKQIASALGLRLENEDIGPVIANQLQKRLLDAKKVLLYFDNVWERLDLEKLGIPPQCKIILTSRDQEVCKQMMTKEDARKILRLDVLRGDESWKLFRENTGNVVGEPHLHQFAVDVANECKGLPLALTTVGSAMREKANKVDWEDALLQLGRAVPTNIRGYIKDVYQPLKLSYDALENDEVKYFFLLCCLFPEDSNFLIEDLVDYGVALGIFSGTTTIREARNRAHNLVETLKNRFLLMHANGSDYRDTAVKMHDVVRDMALSIASKGEHVFMASHYTEAWSENCTCISLILGQEAILPKALKYPKLEALQLEFQYSYKRTRLPESFFDGMTGLRFLCIKNAILFPNLRMLTQLRVLILPYCESKVICEIGKLVNLEILRLRAPKIEMLPREIGALTKLKLLDLNHSRSLTKIAPGVLSSLSQLEELGLCNCPIEWEVEERGSERSNASLAEVFSLRNLSLLDIQIGGLELIPQDTGHLNKVTSCRIKIGEPSPTFISQEIHDAKCIIVQVDERNVGAHAMPALFAVAQRLYLSGSKIDLLARQGFQNLEELEIKNLDTTKHLVTSTKWLNDTSRPTGGIFPVLRKLWITQMKQLEEICHGPPIAGSFSELQDLHLERLGSLAHLWKDPSGKICMSNLKRIKICFCANVKWVFPLLSVAQSLSKLEEIEIGGCPNLEEIFKDERVLKGGVATSQHISFQKLKKLILRDLLKLSTLCKAFGVLEFPSIEILKIQWLPNLPFPPRQQLDLSNNEVVSKIGTEKFYRDVLLTDLPMRLHTLEINFVQRLITLFSYDAFRGLKNLEVLEVSDCLMLEEIVELEQNEEQRGSVMIDKTIIPRLRTLKLSRLPKICYFCTFKKGLELPSLEELNIENCPMMETFAFESFDNRLPNPILSVFFSKEVICPNLRKLVVQWCNLKSLFSPEIFRELANLEELSVWYCKMLEEVIAEEKETVHVGEVQEMKVVWKLPKLELLDLWVLPKMVRFSYLQSDLELPYVERIIIRECPKVESSLSLSLKCLPNGVRVEGISMPKFSSRFFFVDKELIEEKDSLNHDCFKFFQGDLSFTSRSTKHELRVWNSEFFFSNWESAQGEIEIEKLTLGITYEIVFEIMLVKEEGNCKLIIGVAYDELEEDMRDKPTNEWVEILGGEFTPSSGQYGRLQFFVAKIDDDVDVDGVLLNGVYIRPKGITG